MEANNILDQLRHRIDAIDDQILDLLNQRARCAEEVGQHKSTSASEFYVPSREKQIHTRLLAANSGPMPADSVRAIFREIISACLNLEQRLSIAYLGPEATFSHIAAMDHFGQSATYLPAGSIRDAFAQVERGRAHYAVVPIENSTEGVSSSTFDCLVSTDLRIVAELSMSFTHHLMNLSGYMEDIQRIYSHPYAIAQCRQWLDLNLPGIQLSDSVTTARAAALAADDQHTAAICSEQAGVHYGLRPVVRRVDDDTRSRTRFIVVGHTQARRSGTDKTSFIFTLRHAVGELQRTLQILARNRINMTKIESRNSEAQGWEYLFHVDIEGHVDDSHVRQALDELQKHCAFFKLLGSYPRSIESRKRGS